MKNSSIIIREAIIPLLKVKQITGFSEIFCFVPSTMPKSLVSIDGLKQWSQKEYTDEIKHLRLDVW